MAAASVGAVALVAVGGLLYRSFSPSRDGSSDAATAPAVPKTPAQLALEAFAAKTAGSDKVHFFTFPVLRGLSPSLTPFGVRAEVFMRMHKIPYEKHTDGNPAASPNGCVPYMTYKGKIIADSQLMMEFLEATFTSAQEGDATAAAAVKKEAVLAPAVRALTNYCLIPAFLRGVFCADPNRTIYRYVIASFNVVREGNPLAGLLRFAAAKVVGYVLHKRDVKTDFILLRDEQYEELFLRDIESVESLLAQTPFITGEHFTTADAALYALLLPIINLFRRERERLLATGKYAGAADGSNEAVEDALLDAMFINNTLQYIYESEVLNAYVDRISELAFPDLEAILSGASPTVTESQ